MTETKLSKRMTEMSLKDMDISKRTGVERSCITKARLGKIFPRIETVMKICEVTGLRPEDFILPKQTNQT